MQLSITQWFLPRSPLLVSIVLVAACSDEPSTGPSGSRARALTPARAIQQGTPTRPFYFLPPMVADPAPFTGVFDAGRVPTARVVCTGAAGGGCPVLASFTAGGASPGIKVDSEGQSYSAVWGAPSSLALGRGLYALEVYDGAVLLGRADLWVVAKQQELKGVAADYVGVIRGSPLVIKFRIEMERLVGAPDAPASLATPSRAYEPQAEDYRTDHPSLAGMPVSFNTITLIPKNGATVGEVNALLASLGAEIVGGIRGTAQVAGIMVLRLPTTSHEQLAAVLASLRQNPLVATVMRDVGLGSTRIPYNPIIDSDWFWGLDAYGGNWGMEAIRVPQLWNFNAAVKKTGARTLTGVLEAENFENHNDLPPIDNLSSWYPISDAHATHVTGIIAASYDNGRGVDGVNPYADLVFRAAHANVSSVFGMTAAEFIISGFDALVRARPDVRVVNVSIGFNWKSRGIVVPFNDEAMATANASGATVRQLFAVLASEGIPLPVVVAAAGNDSREEMPIDAKWGSPFTNAALTGDMLPPVIVVEALEQSLGGSIKRAPYSNLGGHISAPGSQVLSTVGTSDYAREDGTSMAAPHVTGLVSYLYALAPSLARPTLASNPILDILTSAALPPTDLSAPRIDAFASALAVDQVQGTDSVLRALLDIDDGTLHGNQRTGAGGADFTPDLQTDARPRNKLVDMRDFRRWRDWLLQVEQPLGLVLDGSAGHLKKDLNGDGQVGLPEQENLYPRGDFNGDGRISRTATATVRALGTEPLTDLDVFKRLFSDANYLATDLDNLIESGDLEIDATTCLLVPGAVDAGSSIRVAGSVIGDLKETRGHLPGDARRQYTAPLEDDGYTARIVAHNLAGKAIASAEGHFNFRLGSQARWFPRCLTLLATVEFPSTLVGGQPARIEVTARLRDPLSGEIVPAAGAAIIMGFNAGSVTQARGFTNEEGKYTTFLTPPSTGSGTVRLEVQVFRFGQEVVIEKRADYDPPPPPPEP